MTSWKHSCTPVYAQTKFPGTIEKTIFLAGPTPRDGTPGWRVQALEELDKLGYTGHVFIPVAEDSQWNGDHEAQIKWEQTALHRADVIVFWVPRDLTGKVEGTPLPGLTTNIEWGEWKDSGKALWGAPPLAAKTTYPEYDAKKLGVPIFHSLQQVLQQAVKQLGEGAPRTGGEVCVPLAIWNSKEFQRWYLAQTKVGNRLDFAQVLWTFYPKPSVLFSFALKVYVWVQAEDRRKVNEIILCRPDVSSVCLFQIPRDLPIFSYRDVKIALVREFRSTVRNTEGFVYELPGGSSVNELENPLGVAASEVEEEVGLKLDHTRFKRHPSRQVAATFATYTNTLFSCELTAEEMTSLEQDKTAHGSPHSSERTYIEVRTVQEILDQQLVDWAGLGAILYTIASI